MQVGVLERLSNSARLHRPWRARHFTILHDVAREQTAIAADSALRLAEALSTTAQLWLNPQTD